MRLLDVGCGWGGMVLHAARHHGVAAPSASRSRGAQAELAAKRVAEAGLDGPGRDPVQDYRDVDDGPFDAISSIGMFEHVGARRSSTTYFDRLHAARCARGPAPQPRHRPAGGAEASARRFGGRGFIDRYVFPDGELHEVGTSCRPMQGAGFEVRHVESLREHYALTLRHWVAQPRGQLGRRGRRGRRRPGAGVAALHGRRRPSTSRPAAPGIQQVLAARADGGRSGFPLRPAY